MKYNKKFVLNFAGIFLIFFGILAIAHAVYLGKYGWVFWLCYIGMIIIGIGALTKNPVLIKSQLNILTIPLLIWTLDFFAILFFNNSIFKTTLYFFSYRTFFSIIISFEHFFLVPIGLFSLYLINKKSDTAIKLSVFQLIFMFFITRILTLPQDNVNCAFQSCVSFIPNNQYYLLILFFSTFLMVVIADFFITRLLKL